MRPSLFPRRSSLQAFFFSSFSASRPTHSADPLHYFKVFSSLTKDLSQNPRNFKSLRLLDSLLIQSHLFDPVTSIFVIDCLSQLKKVQRAKSVISHLKTKGNISHYVLYSLILDFVLKDYKITDVESLWNEIPSFESQIDISDYIIHVSRHGENHEIKAVFERIRMDLGSLNRDGSIALIASLCRINEGLLAKEIIQEMNDNDVKVDDFSYFLTFQCLCRDGYIEEADFILRKLVRTNWQIDISVYGSFLYALCKSGRFREANKLFNKLIKDEQSLSFQNRDISLKEGRRVMFQLSGKSLIPSIMVYEAYFRSLCSFGRLDEAEELLKKIMRMKIVPEICIYRSFIKALLSAGREDDAMRFLNSERLKGIVDSDELTGFLIEGLCEKGKIDLGFRILNGVVARGGFVNRVDLFNGLLEGYWKGGRVVEAEGLFGEMKKGSFGIVNLRSYKIMVIGYCSGDCELKKVTSSFDEMVKNNIEVDWEVYEAVMMLLCCRGEFDRVLDYLNKMIETGSFVSSLRFRKVFDLMISSRALG
ncbi:pentatricopeptide repeat-containing protein At1g12775, mitochondrial-like [Impatiens glandulifera]|uniref:pentatricopeptide repeat-containing protein At1g12775, mitochondrial-like n=1 Tax=Impatiens glandulifera TaxID=253017 RepID=UPI001FB09967|nr:pentatricopeptide repeat-containing protein At1g12775, mitochondrial-like [Impatiens glandulifera]